MCCQTYLPIRFSWYEESAIIATAQPIPSDLHLSIYFVFAVIVVVAVVVVLIRCRYAYVLSSTQNFRKKTTRNIKNRMCTTNVWHNGITTTRKKCGVKLLFRKKKKQMWIEWELKKKRIKTFIKTEPTVWKGKREKRENTLWIKSEYFNRV